MPNFVSVNTIVHACSVVFDVSIREIRSPRLQKRTIDARFAACLLAYELTEMSYPQIGRILGRDHTTIIDAVHECRRRCETDQEYAQAVDDARQAIKLIASSDLARLLDDPDAIKTAQRLCDNPFREATRVSTLEAVAMAVRLLALEDVAGTVVQLIGHLSSDIRANHQPQIDAIEATLAQLGYAAPDHEIAPPAKETIHV